MRKRERHTAVHRGRGASHAHTVAGAQHARRRKRCIPHGGSGGAVVAHHAHGRRNRRRVGWRNGRRMGGACAAHHGWRAAPHLDDPIVTASRCHDTLTRERSDHAL
eukprot:690475-Prymnesium_polylepis.1